MKAVMISVAPKMCEKVANGDCTILVRKTRPKIDMPFKCYIYCTYGNMKDNCCLGKRGKVIGYFVCNKVFDIPFTKPFLYYGKKMFHSNNCCKEACLSYIELEDYLGNKDGFGWHISDLVIYDKPREIGEFRLPCTQKQCASWCKDMKVENAICLNKGKRFITRLPQSWCYVEELEE